MRFLHRSAYRTMLFIYLAATLMLYGFSIVIHNSSVNKLKRDMIDSISKMETNYLDEMGAGITKVKGLMVNARLMQDWSQLNTVRGSFNDYPTLLLVNYSQERLEAIRNSSPYIADVRAHFGLWGRTISAQAGVKPLFVDEFNKILMSLDAEGAQFVNEGERVYLTSDYRFKNPTTFSIVAELEPKELSASLARLDDLDNKSAVLINNATQRIVAAAGENIEIDPSVILRHSEAAAGNFAFKLGETSYICVYNTSRFLNFTLAYFLPEDLIYKPLQNYYMMTWVFSSAVLVIVLILILSSYRMIGNPIRILINAYKKMQIGDLSIRLKVNKYDDFAYLYNSFNRMAQNIQQLIEEDYKKEILVQKASLKQLQAQINPHFLYNSFYTLRRMIKLNDNENAERFSAYLGNYFKFITRDSQEEVPLSVEVEHTQTYANIMTMRFGDKVKIRFDELPSAFADVHVPRLMLHPLLENAFEHGLKDSVEEGHVHISYQTTGDDLTIRIEDSGKGMPRDELARLQGKLHHTYVSGEVTGLLNIHYRLRILFGEGYGLSIDNGQVHGLIITAHIRGSSGGERNDLPDNSG